MKEFNFPEEVDYEFTAIALGNFDGVHRAHQRVIENCVKYANEKGIKSGVMLFKNTIKAGAVISDLEERIEIIKGLGVDFIYLCGFDDGFKKQSPEEFAEFLKDRLHIKAVSVGYDYRFGFGAKGTADVLKNLGKQMDFEVLVCEKQEYDGQVISSTNIRNLIENNDLDMAEKLLDRKFSVSGVVKKGFQNGEKLGFKTANIHPEKKRVLPCDGVYSGMVIYKGEKFPAVINIGKNPTFEGTKKKIESHLIGYEGNLYNERITVEFHTFLRGEIKFKSIEDLKKQMEKDREKASKLLTKDG